jgi:hypothetical protein
LSDPQQYTVDQAVQERGIREALISLPAGKNGTFPLPPPLLPYWIKHLKEFGVVYIPELQKKEYHPPTRGGSHWVNNTGRVVKKGTPKPPQARTPDVTKLTTDERAELAKQLIASGELAHLLDSPGPDRAQVTSLPSTPPPSRMGNVA